MKEYEERKVSYLSKNNKEKYIKATEQIRKEKANFIKNSTKPSLRHLNLEQYKIAVKTWDKAIAKYDSQIANILDCYRNNIELIAF